MRYEAFRSLADKNVHVIVPEGAVRRHDHQPLRHLDVTRVLLRRLGGVPLPVALSYIRLRQQPLRPPAGAPEHRAEGHDHQALLEYLERLVMRCFR